MNSPGGLTAVAVAAEKRSCGEPIARLAGILGRTGSAAPDDGFQQLVRGVREFLAATAVALVLRPSRTDEPVVFVDSAPNALMVEAELGALLEYLDSGVPLDAVQRSPLVDLSAAAEATWPAMRRGYCSVIAAPLADRDGAGALFLIDRHPRIVSEQDAVGLSLAATVARGLASEERHRRGADDRHAATAARLSRHAHLAAEVQDVTGNGIAVALGWLDALAGDSLGEAERRRAAESAGRRLTQVQAAVNEFTELTSRSLIEVDALLPTDLAAAWRAVHPYAAAVRGSGSPVVMARIAALTCFLECAAGLLVPELHLDEDHLRLEITDPGQLDLEMRTQLLASEGSLEQRRGSTFANWRLAYPWR